MIELLKTATPYECGIDPKYLMNFAKRLEALDISMHGIMIMRDSRICMETYYKPYSRDRLHRMFSITKSFVSIAIGFLEQEEKLSLDDHITDYFQDKLPKSGVHEYLQMLTIRDMLTMRTCHDKTTYKAPGVTDWVGSFFTTPPLHAPGTQFSYDTSSTHVLCALVERLSGMELLDYLRSKFLDEIGFSKEAYIAKDPNGVSAGGSGLCALPIDILKVLYIISRGGIINGRELIPHDYICAAVKKHSDPYGKSGVIEEMQGYGYQIWMTRNNGYVLYGMGGQLALYVPDKDIFMMTTADVQGRQGGVQLIYDAFWEEIYHKIDSKAHAIQSDDDTLKLYNDFLHTRGLMVLPGAHESPMASRINNVTYQCDSNGCGMTEIKVSLDNNKGTLTYVNQTGRHAIDFAFGQNVFQTFPGYNLNCAASAAWRTENNLLILLQIIDYAVGRIYISVSYKDNLITVMLRKIEENLFPEYNGIFGGKISD